jgi:hypothetical protein
MVWREADILSFVRSRNGVSYIAVMVVPHRIKMRELVQVLLRTDR